MKKVMLATAVAAISLTALYVNAQEMPGPFGQQMAKKADKKFDEIDTNADGVLTLEETLAFHEAKFAFADADGDGMLTKEELKNSRKRMRFDRMDTNDDGFISEDEALSAKGHFSRTKL